MLDDRKVHFISLPCCLVNKILILLYSHFFIWIVKVFKNRIVETVNKSFVCRSSISLQIFCMWWFCWRSYNSHF